MPVIKFRIPNLERLDGVYARGTVVRVRRSILRHASSGRNVGKCVRSGMTATRDDDGDRASGKLLSDIGDDDNESYAGVTLCLEGISSRNWERTRRR